MNAYRQTQSFPPLDTPGKNTFPFALACPSFVYPAGYVDNVRHLAPFVDEIELLFFESRFADSLPSRETFRELARLGQTGGITYNVHLPTDIDLGHTETGVRRRAEEVLTRLVDRCAPLNPTTFTLHLFRDPSEADQGRWQANSAASIETVLATGLPGRRLSVETLDYDFELAAPIIQALNLSVCMDMGHLMLHGIDVAAFFENWRERISIAHLHGVDGDRDHLSLGRLSTARMDAVMGVLNQFTGVVSLEVFSFQALNASMKHLLRQVIRLKAEGV